MEKNAPTGNRRLVIPDQDMTEAEYEAIRTAKRGGAGDPGRTMTYSEELLEITAHVLAEAGFDGERLLQTLKQPSPALGVAPEDVYGEGVGEPTFPEAPVRLEMDDVRWLRETSGSALEIIDGLDDTADDQHDRTVWLLSQLYEFSANALELGVRPALTRN